MKTIRGLQIPQSLAEVCEPSSLALVVYDMQVGIRRQVKDGDRVVSACSRVLASARSAGVRTVFTRHMSLPPEWMGVMAYRTAMAWQRKDDPAEVRAPFLRDSDAFALVPELQPRPSEIVFDKLTMSAFEGTPLTQALRDCGIKAVAFCGIALEIGIEPSVRHGADLGFIPLVIEDACGWGNEPAAARSLDAMRFTGDAVLTDVAGFEAALVAPR